MCHTLGKQCFIDMETTPQSCNRDSVFPMFNPLVHGVQVLFNALSNPASKWCGIVRGGERGFGRRALKG